MQLIFRSATLRSGINSFSFVSKSGSSLGRGRVILPSLQHSRPSNFAIRNLATSQDGSGQPNSEKEAADARDESSTKKKKAISFRSGRPSLSSSKSLNNDTDVNDSNEVNSSGAQLSGRQFTLQGDYSQEATNAKKTSKKIKNVERDLNFDSDFDIPSEDELTNIRSKKKSLKDEVRFVPSKNSDRQRRSSSNSNNKRFADEDAFDDDDVNTSNKRSNRQFSKSTSRDNRQINNDNRGRMQVDLNDRRRFDGQDRNQRNQPRSSSFSKPSRPRFDEDGLNDKRRFDNSNHSSQRNNNRMKGSFSRDDNNNNFGNKSVKRDDYSNRDRRPSNRSEPGERDQYQSRNRSFNGENQRNEARGMSTKYDDRRSAKNSAKSDYLRSVDDLGSGERREMVGLGSSFSAALQKEDDALDAEVRRAVSAHEQKKARKHPQNPQSFDGSNKSRFQQNQMSDDELYGPKIELSSEEGEFFYGKHPIAIALRWTDPKVLQRNSRLYVMEGSEAQDGPEMKVARSKGVQVEIASKMRMNEVMGQPPRPYQGLILELPKINYRTIKKDTVVAVDAASTSNANLLMLALDEINDPMNLGALLRSAHFFGLFAVLASEKNSASLSATVAKASAGAMFVLSTERRLLGSKNLVASLQAHKQAGWRVVGTSASAQGDKVVSLTELPSHPRTILVMGNEEQGLRTLVKAECDILVHIPRPVRPPPTLPTIHSEKITDFVPQNEDATEEDKIALNVSAAGAALLARLRL